jgi:hypothetical protein
MPDGSVECAVILEQLKSIRDELYELKEDIADLKRSRSESDGERSALAKIGAGVIGLCTMAGVAVTVLINWPKITGHQ